MHCHIHLIPRYSEQDALKLEFQEFEKQDLDALCAQLLDTNKQFPLNRFSYNKGSECMKKPLAFRLRPKT